MRTGAAPKTGSFRAGVALSVGLALLLRAPYFGTPLGVDEGGLAFVAQHWVRHGTSLYGDQWLDRPPLLVLLVRLATMAGGDAGLRALGALAAGPLVVLAACLAREIGGSRAGRIAAVLTALLASSIALDAVYTPAELLAAVPAAASVLCLVTALRSGRPGRLVAAGALAASAVLVKQSFLDAGLAGVACLVACALRPPPGFRRTWPIAWVAGAALPVAAMVAASATGYVAVRGLPYALLGFRLEALRALAGSSASLPARSARLLGPALASGLAFAVALAPVGWRAVRRDAVVAATLAAWGAGGVAGVAGGGTYWAHYLIEIVPVAAVLAALALAEAPAVVRTVALRTAVAVACGAAAVATVLVAERPPHRVERAIGSYIRAHARPGDTEYVLYARANVLHYAGLPDAFPYSWSLMLRARPDARPALYRLLDSRRRPTWLVPWQDDDSWRLDRGGIVDVLLRRYYRPAATVAGHVILRRRIAPPVADGGVMPAPLGRGGDGAGGARRAPRPRPPR